MHPIDEGAIDIRATFLRFPSWTQNFWTWWTGKALPGQHPLFVHTWWSYLLVTLVWFSGGISLSAWGFLSGGAAFFLIPLGWVLTVNGARTLFLVILHQTVHRQLSGNRSLDKAIGEVAAILVFNQGFEAFKVAHFVIHHNHRTFATMADPPVERMVRIGLRPGMTKQALWRRALLVMVSPLFHIETFWLRMCAMSRDPSLFRMAVMVVYGTALLAAHTLLPHGSSTMLIAFWFPMIILVQISALLDHLGEHGWLVHVDDQKRRGRSGLAAQSWARFNGAPVPPPGQPWAKRVTAWSAWTAETLLYHLPIRLLVVVGDLPNHDFHHRQPGSKDWMSAAYARQRDLEAAKADSPPYIEFWGLGAAMDHVFAGLSSSEATERGVSATRGSA